MLAFASAGCTSVVGHFFLPKEGVREAVYPVERQKSVGFETRDGVSLVADVYRPRTTGKTPTILVRIPFSSTFKNRLAVDTVGEFWASRGYTVVIQGTRGRYKSSGQFYPLLYEAQDGRETLQWLAGQPWFDGRLGMWGGSAFGHTQWVLAAEEAPGPSALMIQIASTSFREMFHPGGAFSLESALFWAARSHGSEDRDPSFEALERGFAGFPLIEADDRAVGDVAFFNDWARHADAGDYWRRIDGADRARTLKAPVLLMAGWYDPFLPTRCAFPMDRPPATTGRRASRRACPGSTINFSAGRSTRCSRRPCGSMSWARTSGATSRNGRSAARVTCRTTWGEAAASRARRRLTRHPIPTSMTLGAPCLRAAVRCSAHAPGSRFKTTLRLVRTSSSTPPLLWSRIRR
jgi:hypothetical protein